MRRDRCAGWPCVAAEAIRRTRLHFGDVGAVQRGGGIAATGAVVESALQWKRVKREKRERKEIENKSIKVLVRE